MKIPRSVCGPIFLGLALVSLLPATGRAQFTFATNNGAITITGYLGTGGAVVIPATTNGWPVTSIGPGALRVFDCPPGTPLSDDGR